MVRQFLRRLSARFREKQTRTPWYLRPFQALLSHPVYFAPNRRSVAGAVALGLFTAMLPLPGHIVIALVAGLVLRVNLPVAQLVIWVANPLTYPLIFFVEYQLGALLMDLPPRALNLELSWDALVENLTSVWRPIWLGALVGGALLSASGYLAANAAWRGYTRWRFRRRRSSAPPKPGTTRPSVP